MPADGLPCPGVSSAVASALSTRCLAAAVLSCAYNLSDTYNVFVEHLQLCRIPTTSAFVQPCLTPTMWASRRTRTLQAVWKPRSEQLRAFWVIVAISAALNGLLLILGSLLAQTIDHDRSSLGSIAIVATVVVGGTTALAVLVTRSGRVRRHDRAVHVGRRDG